MSPAFAAVWAAIWAPVWAIAGALLLLPSSAAAQNSGLERLTRPDQITSWKAVGRVEIGGQGYCTGTLIAADLVLTAAHCLYGPGGEPHAAASITFRAGYADGAAIATAPVVQAAAHARYQPPAAGMQGLEQIRYDVALLQLGAPISTALAPPFAVDSPGQGDDVSVVSYARGRDEALSWQRACTVLGRQQGLIAVDCDVTFGSSGAPVFDRSQGRARIVSIVSAGMQDGDATVAFGMELPGLVADLKQQLRAGRVTVPADPPAAGLAVPGARRITVGQGRPAAGGARFVRAPAP